MVNPQHQIVSNCISIRTIILYDTFINLQIKYRVFKIKCSQYPHFKAYILLKYISIKINILTRIHNIDPIIIYIIIHYVKLQ